MRDAFLLRTLEHWLDTVNELTYQPLFCEWLLIKGHQLKVSIRNTNFEQGKDVISVGPDGTPFAFQLKGGNINLHRWRTEVKPEIEALIETPIQHPAISKENYHISYLVTNGEIEDNVRSEIVALNEGRWKGTPLKYWTRGDLLAGFSEMTESVLPRNVSHYKTLLDLVFADGTGWPDLGKIAHFLEEVLFVKDRERRKSVRRRDIAAALVYTSMIAGPYRVKSNHAAVVRILAILCSYIFFLAETSQMKKSEWHTSYFIVFGDILSSAALLEKEVNDGGFETEFDPALETDLIPIRKYAAITVIHAYRLSKLIRGEQAWEYFAKNEEQYKNSLMIWGEASLLTLILLHFCFLKSPVSESQRFMFIKMAVQSLLVSNGRNSSQDSALPPPYYDADFHVKRLYGLLKEPFEESFKLKSYYLKPLLDVLVRGKQRIFVSENWKEISFIHCNELIITSPQDLLLWRIEEAENRTWVFQSEQSWSLMQQEANLDWKQLFPTSLRDHPDFIPFWLVAMPHRVNSITIGYLDNLVNSIKFF